MEVIVFEVSARIVAGTNPFVTGSPYSDYIQPELSTGRRIAQEIKLGKEKGLLHEIIT
jgi:5-formaminoimidazole-4-carboxamide-1-(beta)-D-ribofuranosyl 5'-monophosphate synthetase